MNTKSKLAQRAAIELTDAANALDRASALFRFVLTELIDCKECPGDVLQLARIGIELTTQYGERAGGEASYFEDEAISSHEKVDLQSSTEGE
jgi:hypothetical protein